MSSPAPRLDEPTPPDGSTRRPDASMDLLRTVQREAVDPDYAAAARAGASPRSPRARLVALALTGCLLTIAAVQTSRSAPDAADERRDLLQHAASAQSAQASTRARVAELDAQVRALQAEQLPTPSPGEAERAALTGMGPVHGPGVVITVDDAAQGTSGEATTVSDQDLRVLVNALWSAGAEAVAVNGHRVSNRTAIRDAGSAITVDYTSLQHPYRLEAIGDPQHLAQRVATTSGGQWWAFLRDTYGVTYQTSSADDLRLPADPGLSTVRARPQR